MRDQRIFIRNNLYLNILSEDKKNTICKINIKNIFELLAYLEPSEEPSIEKIHIFQPDIFIKKISFDSSNIFIKRLSIKSKCK